MFISNNFVKKKLTYIDLFAGCGGLSLGLHNAGWKGIFAIEKNKHAFETLEHNLILNKNHFSWPKWLPQSEHDINEVISNYSENLKSLQGKVSMIVGGPPCQGFSIAGRRNEKDERNELIHSYINFVNLVKPKLIFFENVKGFTMEFKNNKEKGIKYSQVVTEELEKSGYNVFGKLINFGEYGVPQKRTRFILVGIRKDLKNSSKEIAKSFFDKIEENKFSFLNERKLSERPTIKEAISDLLTSHNIIETPDRKGFKTSLYKRSSSNYQKLLRKDSDSRIPNSHSLANHSVTVVERLRYIINVSKTCKNLNQKIKDELGIKKQVLTPLKDFDQCPTLTSNPDDLIHYCEPRTLTVREYARIQSFPDWFEFRGKYTTGGKLRKFDVPRYTQIGNAIPPLFGEQSGLILKEFV